MKSKTEILHDLTDDLPLRFIDDPDGRRYLERYYLGTWFGWRFYVHQFVGPDPDRGLHDHPWTLAFSLRLAGYYYELTRAGMRKQRWLGILTGDTFHRVATLATPSVWTLFAHTVGDVKPWGFWRAIDGRFAGGMYPEGSAIFEPFQYKSEGGKPVEWWHTALSRRQRREFAT